MLYATANPRKSGNIKNYLDKCATERRQKQYMLTLVFESSSAFADKNHQHFGINIGLQKAFTIALHWEQLSPHNTNYNTRKSQTV